LLVTTYAALAGLAMLLPFLVVEPQATHAVFSSSHALMLMFFLGLIGSALGFLWYSEAMLKIGAVGTAVYINLTPVFGVVAASVFLGEKSSQSVLLGGLVVCASLMLVNRPRWPWRRAAQPAVPAGRP
jgi:drug/metabolite transporter (DMT)-like permease